jgi:hypothetical protein
MFKLGIPVVAQSFLQEDMIGAIVAFSPYSPNVGGSYKIEWSDGSVRWYSQVETAGYAEKAIRMINDI